VKIYDADRRMMRMERYASNGKLLNAFVYSYTTSKGTGFAKPN
jgi:hypothetical protein